jgi:hypothetical protein
MRDVEVEEGLVVRFPGRSDDFVEGIEIGLLLAALALGAGQVERWMPIATVAQAEALATRMKYFTSLGETYDGLTLLTFSRWAPRPKLKLVHSR